MTCRLRVVVLVSCLLMSAGRASAAPSGSAGQPPPAFLADVPPRAVPGEVLVRFRHSVRRAERDGLTRAIGARALHRFAFIDVDHLQVSGPVDSALARLRADPRVLYAEPNFEVHAFRTPDDPRFGEQYGLQNLGQTGGTPGADISAPHAWDVFTGDSTLKIGMIDSGIDYTHPDLAANVWTNPGEIPGNGIDDDGNGYVDDVHGYDFASNDGDPMDDNGHGTHTAGIVAAVGNNGQGVCGVAWRAQLVAIKFLNASGSGTIANAIAAVEYATAVGCRLTSNSWGGGGASQALLDAINAAGEAGELFVAAAGNAHQNLDIAPIYPAAYASPYIVSVAASDDQDNLAGFSNYGPNTVDLAAPGVSILSTLPDNRYATLSGTSMACPMVAGAAALALGQSPQLDPLRVKALLLVGADHPSSLSGRIRGGRLNAFNAVATPDSVPPGPIADLTPGEVGSNSLELNWTATGDDGGVGRASSYELRWSTAPLTPANFAAATRVAGTPDPMPAGTAEHFVVTGLPFSSTVYVALRALDEFLNVGPLSNVVTATTLGIPRLAFAPDSVSSSLTTGGADSAFVTLTNTGAGTLDFNIPTPAIAYGMPPAHEPIPYAKGQGGPAGQAVTGHAGGPDGFGYRWIDSDTTAGPRFEWIDVTAVGTPVDLNGDDNLSPLIPLGFRFPLYGTNFDSVRVCTNGYLTFTDVLPLYANQPLPSPAAPGFGVMPFWDDLVFAAERRAWVWSDGARFVVEFVAVPHFDTGGPYTFEVVLTPAGEIRFQYLQLADPTNTATVGVQDGPGDNGLQVVFNGAYLHDSLAVKLVPMGQWAAVSPAQGRVQAGASVPVGVRFAAAGLAGGDYRADLRIETNDPDAAVAHLPLRLHVTGAPDLQAAPAVLDFGDVYVGARPVRTLALSNPGTDSLAVGSIVASDSTLHNDTTSFVLARFQKRTLPVLWAPSQPGDLVATLRLSSNDPDLPQLDLPVRGRALPAPSVATAPESLNAELATGASVAEVLHVMNRGAGEYVFRAVPLSSAGSPRPVIDFVEPPRGKGEADPRRGATPRNAGGPDAFGYTFRDSREADGAAFQWEDVRGRGVAVALSGDDALSAPLSLRFDFPCYGESFRSLRVCTNGFVTLSDTTTGFSNTPLPSQATGVPANLLAVLWDDLVFPAGTSAWFFSDSAHAVVQFQDVPRFGELGRPNTFEIAIDASGTIEYRYLAVRAQNLASSTVGIQNGARDDGLLVAFNAPYLSDSLAVRFTRPPRWLTVTPDSGRIPAGGGTDLSVVFHAAGLAGGRYDGRVQLDGNDPLAPHQQVPAHLRVIGVPALAVDPAALDFGTVSVGDSRTLALRIANAGSDTLRIEKLASSDGRYVVLPDRFAVGPFAERAVDVIFRPDVVGGAGASLTLRSNDPTGPERVIGLTARGAEPPRAALSGSAVRAALAHDAGERALAGVERVVVRNLGGNPLLYHARALPGPGVSAATDPVQTESPKGAVEAPGALGAGGPDSFGYRWLDSDEPGGPPFDWIDARAGGQPVALTGDDQMSDAIALPFRFPFYGAGFDSIRICSNGFASFTSTLPTYTNTPLPNAGAIAPENLLAAYWDDQDFRAESGHAQAFVRADSDRFVIAFYDVPHLTVGGPYTYEIVLQRDGTADYQYLAMGPRLTEATIGIQNGDRSSGLQVAYNAGYVHDRLRVRFTRTPPWLAVSPDSGAVEPGGADTLSVRFSAIGIPDGDYDGLVRLDDNELRGGLHELPAHLHVGLAAARVRVDTPALAVTAADRTAHLGVSVAGVDARAIDPASVRIDDSIAVVADTAASTAATAALRIDVLDLLRPWGGGDRVPLDVTGEVPGQTWFVARDTLRLERPALLAPALPRFGSGDPRAILPSDGGVDLAWSEAPGVPVTQWDVWFSPDAGRQWMPLAVGQRDRSLRWFAPALAESAMIEIVGRRQGANVTAFLSNPFRLAPRDSLNGGHPVAFGLRLAGGNPAREAAAFRLALPGGGTLDLGVFDVTGARVRTLARGRFSAEYLSLIWDLRDDRGRAVRPGIYFVRAASQGRLALARVAVVR